MASSACTTQSPPQTGSPPSPVEPIQHLMHEPEHSSPKQCTVPSDFEANADAFLERMVTQVSRAPSLAPLLAQLEAVHFCVRPLRLGDLRSPEHSITVSSLLELLSCAAHESAASQAVLETLVLMLSSGQVTHEHGHDPAESASSSSPLRTSTSTRPLPLLPLAHDHDHDHDATSAGTRDGSGEASGRGSLGLPYVPYVPLVAEHTRTRRAAGFVLLSLELKFLHLCTSRGRLENLVVSAEFERECGTLVRHALLRTAVELARALGCYKVTALRPAPASSPALVPEPAPATHDQTQPPAPAIRNEKPAPPDTDSASAHVNAAFDEAGIQPDLGDYHMLLFVPK